MVCETVYRFKTLRVVGQLLCILGEFCTRQVWLSSNIRHLKFDRNWLCRSHAICLPKEIDQTPTVTSYKLRYSQTLNDRFSRMNWKSTVCQIRKDLFRFSGEFVSSMHNTSIYSSRAKPNEQTQPQLREWLRRLRCLSGCFPTRSVWFD